MEEINNWTESSQNIDETNNLEHDDISTIHYDKDFYTKVTFRNN